MSSTTFTVNGRPVSIDRAAAPARKHCKFCRAVNRVELAATTCDHVDGYGKRCGAGLCSRHSITLGPDKVHCPLHDPDRGGPYLPEAA